MSASMTMVDCARMLGAKLIDASSSPIGAVFQGVSTDSRTIAQGELFVALKGENFDGHEYVAKSAARGAAAALVSRVVDSPIPQIVVGNTMFAYGQLAQLWRSRFTTPILAITGSNGKTTVKEMLRAILVTHVGREDAVLATEGNLNNNIGVPQMMLRIANTHQQIVLEMGMNHLHEIDYLTRLAVPDVALIIMAGTAHIGELGSREAIAEAKGEIYAGLKHDGVACVNADDRFADYWKSLIGTRRIVTFGTSDSATVRGELTNEGLMLHANGHREAVKLNVAGEHNQRNAIAAAAGAWASGVPLTTIARGLASFGGVDGRLRTYAGVKGAVVIDDTYNANPDSMKAAIAVLAKHTGHRVLVLGDMGELGADAAAMHAEIGRDARNANIDAVFGLGDLAVEYVRMFGEGATHYKDVESLVAALNPQLDANTTVLVKGSRFMKMERVVAKIATDYATNATKKGNH
jgi:UDP-N-acetylmuramoyl-tripeptide--D-alanyl-D-alanine ligase